MTETDPAELGLVAKLVMVVAIVLIVAGVLWHGLTVQTFERFWYDLIDRTTGPMKFRLILQPSMAAIAGIREGLKDARTGRSPYFMTILRNPQERVGRLREGLNATARILALGLVMDAIYQVLVLRTFYPFEALAVALLLAFVPYLIVRGLVVHLWRSTIFTLPKA
jgi:hypothetical protein